MSQLEMTDNEFYDRFEKETQRLFERHRNSARGRAEAIKQQLLRHIDELNRMADYLRSDAAAREQAKTPSA